jgi:hypothetical protein
LSDDNGQEIDEVEGSIQPAGGTQGTRTGSFELAENGSFMQGVLEEKGFHLRLDDGSEVSITIDSVSTSKPGYSVVQFSCS